jgi:hypothetical protein
MSPWDRFGRAADADRLPAALSSSRRFLHALSLPPVPALTQAISFRERLDRSRPSRTRKANRHHPLESGVFTEASPNFPCTSRATMRRVSARATFTPLPPGTAPFEEGKACDAPKKQSLTGKLHFARGSALQIRVGREAQGSLIRGGSETGDASNSDGNQDSDYRASSHITKARNAPAI